MEIKVTEFGEPTSGFSKKTVRIKRPAGCGGRSYSRRYKRSNSMRGTFIVLGLFLLGIALFGIGTPIIKKIQFNVGCEGYLKSAGDAPTIELAKTELDTAIQYMEDKDLTDGHSHLIIKNRQADVGYWYERVKAARSDLDTEMNGEQEKEALRVLRESLLDNGDSGTVVTHPPHIHIFPHQWFWTIALFVSFIVGFFGFIFVAAAVQD